MKKWIALLLVVLLGVFALAACDSDNTPENPEHTHAFDQKNAGDNYLKSGATVDSPAVYYYSCQCGEKGTETFAFGNALSGNDGGDGEHIYRDEWTYDDEKHWIACIDLSCDVRKQEAKHTFGDWVIDEEPTCTTEGTQSHSCVVCGKSVSETIPVNPIAHNYATTWTRDDTNHWYKCQNSGCASVREKSAHTWDKENTCTVCQRYKDGHLSFMMQNDGTYQVSDYTGSAFEIIIPSVYHGIPVTSIASFAFSYCRSLTSITIPSGVTSIGAGAFKDCMSLTSITIPSGVTSIGVGAFENCTSLKSITIPDSVTSIGVTAFENCTSLTSITIPHSVTSIGDYAFRDCTGLTSITVPDSVTSIGEGAFENCTSLTSITISSGVTSIGWYVFRGCTSLASITIPDSVTKIGKDAFSNCRSLASITIPSGVTSIGPSAFAHCTSLKSITIPAGVTSISSSTFYNCTDLTSITFGENSRLRGIGKLAFDGCTSLESITFGGTVTQWQNISKDRYWNSPITVTCTDGTVTEKYN